MRILPAPLAAVASVLLLAACSEPTGEQTATPALDFTNGPATPGPYAIRYEDTFGWGHADYRRGWSAVYGVNPVELCQGTFDPDLVPVHAISIPQDVDRLISLARGSVRAWVWPFTDFDCTLFQSTAPLATGMVEVTYTDNDLFAYLRDFRNSNAYGLMADGVLVRPDGSEADYHAISRALESPSDPSRFIFANMIDLR